MELQQPRSYREDRDQLEELWNTIKEAHTSWNPQEIWEFKYKKIIITVK